MESLDNFKKYDIQVKHNGEYYTVSFDGVPAAFGKDKDLDIAIEDAIGSLEAVLEYKKLKRK